MPVPSVLTTVPLRTMKVAIASTVTLGESLVVLPADSSQPTNVLPVEAAVADQGVSSSQ